jgi:predicted nucleic acid-binding protein
LSFIPELPTFVLDTSVALKWFVERDEPDRRKALELRDASVAERCVLLAPEFILLELSNALRTGRRFTRSEIVAALRDFLALDIVLEPVQPEVLRRAVEIAFVFDTAVYDSYFLALAKASEAVLITADEVFLKRARAIGNLESLRMLRLSA